MLITSIFFFCHNVFKRVSYTGLLKDNNGKELNATDSNEFEHKNDENIAENGENAMLLWFIESYNSVITHLIFTKRQNF